MVLGGSLRPRIAFLVATGASGSGTTWAVAIGVSGSGAADDGVPVTFEAAGGESMQLPTVWEVFVCSQGACSLGKSCGED